MKASQANQIAMKVQKAKSYDTALNANRKRTTRSTCQTDQRQKVLKLVQIQIRAAAKEGSRQISLILEAVPELVYVWLSENGYKYTKEFNHSEWFDYLIVSW